MRLNREINRVLFETLGRLRALFAPRYHPELHYMRGPGPACARRMHRGDDKAGLI